MEGLGSEGQAGCLTYWVRGRRGRRKRGAGGLEGHGKGGLEGTGTGRWKVREGRVREDKNEMIRWICSGGTGNVYGRRGGGDGHGGEGEGRKRNKMTRWKLKIMEGEEGDPKKKEGRRKTRNGGK